MGRHPTQAVGSVNPAHRSNRRNEHLSRAEPELRNPVLPPAEKVRPELSVPRSGRARRRREGFQAPNWSASSANPPTTTSVRGVRVPGSGGPAGPPLVGSAHKGGAIADAAGRRVVDPRLPPRSLPNHIWRPLVASVIADGANTWSGSWVSMGAAPIGNRISAALLALQPYFLRHRR